MTRARHATGESPDVGRRTRRFRKLRAKFREWCRTHENADGTIGAHCWLCDEPIDYELPAEHPQSFSLDHAYSVSARPDLAEDPANFRPSHLDCNKQRGDGDPFIQLGSPSENW